MQVVKRDSSLDSLRGIAIILMVLSGSIAFSILPGWMYHAQVPPPGHKFMPEIPGITWVDLVFPFFLFSMGAAIPLAMKKKIENSSSLNIFISIVKRFVLLTFFALFTMHARAWVLSSEPGLKENLLSILCFVLLFAIYGDFGKKVNKRTDWAIKIVGILLAIGVMFFGFSADKKFNLFNPDIIILVLANMAFFGTIIWWLTAKNLWLRVGVLPFVMAIFLASKEPGSINEAVFNWTPAAWLYKFYYLKYLFIILPSTLVGEWIIQDQTNGDQQAIVKKHYSILAIVGFLLIVCNVVCLYSRHLELNLLFNAIFAGIALYIAYQIKKSHGLNIVVKLIYVGSYLLFLGLFFEAFEGGIKKDYSTYSYYFVCTGLAFFMMLVFYALNKIQLFKRFTNMLAMVGKNPMIAYTAGNLLLIPILKITNTEIYLNSLQTGFAGGLLRGVLFTAVVTLVTIIATKKGVFWKT